MRTYHIIYEVTFNKGNTGIFSYEIPKNDNVFSCSFDDNEKVLGVEVVDMENTTDFRFHQGRVCNFGTPCSEIVRERGKKAISQFKKTIKEA